jgi:hypothetical protein
MGKSQRTKGHAYERRVARLLRAVTGAPYYRVDETREGQGVDVICQPKEDRPLWEMWENLIVQCKAREKLSVVPSYREARQSKLNGLSKVPVLWHHKNRGPHLVTLDESDFLAMLYLMGTVDTEEWDEAKGVVHCDQVTATGKAI